MLVDAPAPPRKPGMVALAPPLRLEPEVPPGQDEGPSGKGEEGEGDLVEAGDVAPQAELVAPGRASRLPLRCQAHHVAPGGYRGDVRDPLPPPFRPGPVAVHAGRYVVRLEIGRAHV